MIDNAEIIENHFDEPWKDVLGIFLRDFLSLCFPEMAEAIDWYRPPEAMDKELSALTGLSLTGTGFVDRLFKAYDRDGGEFWFCIHIEVQAQKERQFPKRMFMYYYRIHDKHRVPVVSVAILGDAHRDWRPQAYETAYHGCELSFRFPMVKLTDFEDPKNRPLGYEQSPFGVIIDAHLEALKSKDQPQLRYQAKKALLLKLVEKFHPDKEKVKALLRFVDDVIALPKPLELQFNDDISHLEQEKGMSYMGGYTRAQFEKGLQQGIEQGVQQGMQQGMQQGAQQNLHENVKALLKAGIPPEFLSKAMNLSAEEIHKIQEAPEPGVENKRKS